MMKTLTKWLIAGVAMLSLNGCFFAEQIHDKIYEDCYVHPDHIKTMPSAEYQRLANKCGWDKQQNRSERPTQTVLDTARLCRETVPAPSADGKHNGQISHKLPSGMTLQYRVVNGVVPDLKVLYPNGSTETHTRFANGKAEGWSEGYYPSGKVHTRFFYQNGKAKRYEVYGENGKLVERNELNCSE